MLTLLAKTRKDLGKKIKKIRKMGVLPGILYGPKIKNLTLEINLKEFEKIYQEAGESSLISLEVDNKKFSVLIHQVQLDSLTSKPIHVDFYQPSLKEEITAKVPLVFEEEAPAVKELGGTLVKNISEVEVKALPQNLPHEIKVNVISLQAFENNISIKDLKLPPGVKILKGLDEIVAFVAPPEKVEEELAKPAEEKVEEVEKVEKPEKEMEEKEEVEVTKEGSK